MAVVDEYRKVKCDNCGKEKIVDHSGQYPSNWLIILITEWIGLGGYKRYNKDVCSDKCALKLLHNLNKIPKIPINSLKKCGLL